MAACSPPTSPPKSRRSPGEPLAKPVYEGRDAVLLLWEFFTAAWETITIEIDEVTAGAAGRVAARTRFLALRPASGVEVDRVLHYAFRIEDGLVRWIHPYESEVEALEAVGLRDHA